MRTYREFIEEDEDPVNRVPYETLKKIISALHNANENAYDPHGYVEHILSDGRGMGGMYDQLWKPYVTKVHKQLLPMGRGSRTGGEDIPCPYTGDVGHHPMSKNVNLACNELGIRQYRYRIPRELQRPFK